MKFLQRAGILLAGMLIPVFLFAQTDALRTKLNSIFQNIDKSQVPTGYLEEYGAGLVPLDIFNGILTDSNRLDIDLWRYSYGSFWTSKILGTNTQPDLATINTAIDANSNYNTNLLSIPIALMNFSQMREDAVQQNLFTVTNEQIFDVAGRTQSPYIPKTLFMACPSKNYSASGSVSFLFKSNLFYTNTGKSIGSLSVDFANGNGYQQATLNIPIAVNYTDTGYKRLKFKLICTDNSLYECYAEFQVLSVSGSGNMMSVNLYEPPVPGIDIVQPFPATANHSGGTVTVRMSRKGTERTITKPLIVLEGYDVSDKAPFLRLNPFDYDQFIFNINNQPDPYSFNQKLDDIAGYDLIFINYTNGTDDILKNAALF